MVSTWRESEREVMTMQEKVSEVMTMKRTISVCDAESPESLEYRSMDILDVLCLNL
jgi:hypothetical protein